MRVYYADYARHCMRFYLSDPRRSSFRNSAEERDWTAARQAVLSFTAEEQGWLTGIYRHGPDLSGGVRYLSACTGAPQAHLWRLVNRLDRRIAERRGLLAP